ncbi:AAA family ATPase [Synechococcales cyanobacterium C]|uniref:AAA family ATPase n=1 Tax=Petrachloros mirabilis ULC683 TaxID=2781853 RepID=A0A8K2A8P1_9CYAN|nr:ribulose bisphosphate carboxylase small subunit [Petrachloros mirabilis]NCJ07389.1 AAA family ATPase [Petrachloros mirabilis ULC683]
MAYYIAPQFLNKVAVHITKNFLELPGIRVPLILGIHGHKGEGKTFQCELTFKKMKVEVVHLSAGELESPDAGDPARLIRLRYREAADIIRKHGRMAVMIIHDIDAGAGRVDGSTQYTVNTQLVNATLMNIADHPTNVQLPGSYDSEPLPRVPIIVTGNDFGTLYAPLVRDGRMEKFYWEPTWEDRIGIVSGIFEPDGITRPQAEQLVNHFSGQSIDFFGALRARIYDEQVLSFVQSIGFERIGARLVNTKEAPPEFRKPDFSLPHLFEQGKQMVQEQVQLQALRLASRYNRSLSESEVPPSAPRPSQSAPPSPRQSTSSQPSPPSTTNGSRSLDDSIAQQVRSLLMQGYRLGIEHVDKRRFRVGSWKSCGAGALDNESEALSAVAACIHDHTGEYIRIFGIEPRAKRRVMETIIQRP